MNKIFLILASIILKIILNIIFVTCNWKVANIEVLNNSIKSKSPLLICSWHQRFYLLRVTLKILIKKFGQFLARIKTQKLWLEFLKGGIGN